MNTDKTDLFYNLMLKKTPEFRGRWRTGSKNSWEGLLCYCIQTWLALLNYTH